mgnify:FL=1
MKNKTKRKNRIFRVLLATMLILFGVSFRMMEKLGLVVFSLYRRPLRT